MYPAKESTRPPLMATVEELEQFRQDWKAKEEAKQAKARAEWDPVGNARRYRERIPDGYIH